MSSKNTFYVTTPIYYVTAKPHLGSLYSTLMADVVARWQRLQAKQVLFVTGTDEHGQKIATAANQAGKEPKAFVDSFIDDYINTWREYDITYSQFIRTTDPGHIKAVQSFITQLLAQGDIYKDTYSGWYCTPCETFLTHKDYQNDEKPPCPTCGRPTHFVSEETYFFRLSAYQERLLRLYHEHAEFIVPRERAHEVISFVESGLKDLSISRTTVAWGIPFPQDPAHTVYVWIDALIYYVSAIGFSDTNKTQEFMMWWPPHLQILGKDIIRFHAVYWPALLMAAGLPVPKQLLVHGWIKINKQKMSKSFGNVIDPLELKKKYGTDAVRYYLLRYLPIAHDGDFSTADLERTIENDLANDLSNLLNRMLSLASQHGVSVIHPPAVWSQAALDLRDECWNMVEDVDGHMQDCQFHLALARVWGTIKLINAYFHEQEPWKVIKTDEAAFIQILSAVSHGLLTVAWVLDPFMPTKMRDLRIALGVPSIKDENIIAWLEDNPWLSTFTLKKIDYLFQRIVTEKEVDTIIKNPENQSQNAQANISIDEFKKVELVVGTIKECVALEESDKLLKLQVDFADKGVRQILTGLKKFYKPDDLMNMQVLFILNLQPRKIMGYESHGMLLTVADTNGIPQLLRPLHEVANGGRLQ